MGRALLYCGKCRQTDPPRIATYDCAIPVEVLTPALFRKLYEFGFTASDLAQACEIAFGYPRPRLVRRIKHALAKRLAEKELT